LNTFVEISARFYDNIEHYFHGKKSDHYFSIFFVSSFIGAIIIIQLNVMGLLPYFLSSFVPHNHMMAVTLVLNFILVKEVLDMIFSLSYSVSAAQRKQLEVLSLILLRSSFKELSNLHNAQSWEVMREPVLHILSYGFSALIIFVFVLYYYKLKNIPMLYEVEEKNSFVAEKKSIALILLINFIVIAFFDFITALEIKSYKPSFADFFNVFIFGDILIVLVSFKYSKMYFTVFRNSGFALATVLIRIAMTSPPFIQEALGILTAVFAYGIAYAYNKYSQGVFDEECKKRKGLVPRRD